MGMRVINPDNNCVQVIGVIEDKGDCAALDVLGIRFIFDVGEVTEIIRVLTGRKVV
jgi:hypothetical protein